MRDHRVPGVAPDRVRAALRPILPGDLRKRAGADNLDGPRRLDEAHADSSRRATDEVVGLELDECGADRIALDRGVRAGVVRLHVLPLAVQVRHRSQQHLGVGVLRIAEDLDGRAHLDDHAAPQDHGPVADVVAEREIVRDEEDAEPACLEVAEQVQDVDARRRVEHADDLVGDEEIDVEQQRTRDQQALELPSAQLVRVLVQDLCRVERHGLERGLDLAGPVVRPDRPGSTHP